MSTPVVSRLFVYPVKSAAGIQVSRAEVEARGFRHDRRWMVVDPDGRFLTQRAHPRMARITVGLEADALVLEAPGMPRLTLPLEPTAAARCRVVVWDDQVDAVDVGAGAGEWLSAFLEAPARLVHMPEDSVRPAPHRPGTRGARVGFADRYPFLLLSEASLDGLNARLADPVPMDRFRPNIVVQGVEPHAEDGWTRIRIAGIEFDVAKACARCSMTTVDQATGRRGREPLRTLARYRTVDGKVLFGQNLLHRGRGPIRVGDRVEIL